MRGNTSLCRRLPRPSIYLRGSSNRYSIASGCASYVHSTKGKGGGFLLSKSPDRISLAEIIRLFDGALAPTESVSKYFYGPTPIEKEGRLLEVFRGVRDYVADKMENTRLSDVM